MHYLQSGYWNFCALVQNLLYWISQNWVNGLNSTAPRKSGRASFCAWGQETFSGIAAFAFLQCCTQGIPGKCRPCCWQNCCPRNVTAEQQTKGRTSPGINNNSPGSAGLELSRVLSLAAISGLPLVPQTLSVGSSELQVGFGSQGCPCQPGGEESSFPAFWATLSSPAALSCASSTAPAWWPGGEKGGVCGGVCIYPKASLRKWPS